MDTSSLGLEDRRDSGGSLMSLETVADLPTSDVPQMSPRSDRIRHHLIPARTSTCVRAPCLKRQISTPFSVSNVSMPASAPQQQDRIVSNPLPTSFAYSHSVAADAEAPATSRRVHFDQAPPQEFFVLSGEKYDRTSIKCTQGGSAFDMSLPPRAMSMEAGENTDEHTTLLGSLSAPAVGPVCDSTLDSWASIKNGAPSLSAEPRKQQSGLMASGKSLHFSALSSLQHASALAGHETPPLERKTSEQVSLPVHGIRSFGRLGGLNSLGLSSGICTPPQQEEVQVAAPSPKLSPDATPMPSPSLHRALSWNGSGEYFDGSSSRANNEASQQDINPSQVLTEPVEVLSETFEPLQSRKDCSTPLANSENISTPPTPLGTAKETLLERRSLEAMPQASLLHPYPSSLLTSHVGAGAGWSNLLSFVGSPLSSRCSSADPWSSLSSDGDDSNSPNHEANWTSSSCTSPDLAPSEQSSEVSASQPKVPCVSQMQSKPSERTLPVPIGGADASAQRSEASDLNQSTPKESEFSEDFKLSSSVETVHVPASESKQVSATPLRRLSSESSIPEVSSAESSRRPSFRLLEAHLHTEEPLSMYGEDDDVSLSRISLTTSRDGHVKKSKHTRCKACRLLRHRFKSRASGSSHSPSSPASLQVTDAETDSSAIGTPPMQRSYSSSDHEPAEPAEMNEVDKGSSFHPTRLRATVRSQSMCDSGGSYSSSSTRSRSTDRSMSFDSSTRSASPRVKQGLNSILDQDPTYSPVESSSESPYGESMSLPLACTCDKKRDKERLKKKIRKERELERERDREWEQNEARGRQQRLFGESFGEADGSCLDGF